MKRSFFALALLALACDTPAGDPDASTAMPDGGPGPEPDAGPPLGTWIMQELPGTACGNGDQYRFFVRYTGSEDVMVMFEAGGACWDYESCTGGARGAAHPDGIPVNLMDTWGVISPFLLQSREMNPFLDWNVVFVPYCTGDVHIGDRDITYEDPTGVGEPLEWHHAGYDNTQAIISWMQGAFPAFDRLLVTGCSAGGTGSINNYYALRTQLNAQRGYMIDDSGPIFPSESNSAPLHAMIRDVWNLDSVIERSFGERSQEIIEDFGAINTVLAEEFPDDRFVTAFFRLDYNYSLYSYERFYESPDRSAIYRMWWEDTQELAALYDRYDNLAYYIPFYRDTNDSHCLTLLYWLGTEIEEDGIDFREYVVDTVLDDSAPLESHLEEAREGPFEALAP